ncbi:MAG: hypothetical protein AAGJ08_22515 [Cyanobacteria bacterium P01_H01_bin.35]
MSDPIIAKNLSLWRAIANLDVVWREDEKYRCAYNYDYMSTIRMISQLA